MPLHPSLPSSTSTPSCSWAITFPYVWPSSSPQNSFSGQPLEQLETSFMEWPPISLWIFLLPLTYTRTYLCPIFLRKGDFLLKGFWLYMPVSAWAHLCSMRLHLMIYFCLQCPCFIRICSNVPVCLSVIMKVTSVLCLTLSPYIFLHNLAVSSIPFAVYCPH